MCFKYINNVRHLNKACYVFYSLTKGRNFPFVATLIFAFLGATQPPVQWITGVKRSGRETEVKIVWSYTSTLTFTFMTRFLINDRQVRYCFTIPYIKECAFPQCMTAHVIFTYLCIVPCASSANTMFTIVSTA